MSLRTAWIDSTDSHLLADCDVDTYRASGPGGQKRNKTSSAVRLRHRPSGLIVIAEESRSQHENKAKAVKRLRQAFALKLRESFEMSAIDAIRGGDGRLHLATAKDPRFWPAVAAILDAIEEAEAQVRSAAERMGVTTANLLSILELDAKAWEQINIARQKFGHKPLTV